MNDVTDSTGEYPFIVEDARLARWLATQGFDYEQSGDASEAFAFEAKAEAAAVARGRHERRLEQWRRYGRSAKGARRQTRYDDSVKGIKRRVRANALRRGN